jgi:hypothetical protein
MKLITPRIVEHDEPAVWEGVVLLLMAIPLSACLVFFVFAVTL